MFTKEQIEDLVDLLVSLNESTKIYFGCDSVRFRKNDRWYAKYATVCVVHMNGKHGCRVFKHKSIEPDYDMKKNRPSMRLMNEVQKVAQLYVQLAPFIDDYEIEIHLDINPNKEHNSSLVVQQAVGYIKGVCMVEPKVKPLAFAASAAADRYKSLAA